MSVGQISLLSLRQLTCSVFAAFPELTVTTDYIIVSGGERFEITSVENVKGRGMYTEVLAKKVVASNS